METQLKRYRTYEGIVKRLLLCSGLWPRVQDHPILLRFLSFQAGFTSIVMCGAVINFCYHYRSNIITLTKGLSLAVGFATATLKVYCFLAHRKSVEELYKSLEQAFTRDLQFPDRRPDLLTKLSQFSGFSYSLIGVTFLTNVLFACVPLMGLREGKYLLIYPGVFPFTYEPGGTVFWCLYGFELMAMWFLWTITGAVDSIFGFCAFQMCGQLRTLAAEFRALEAGKDYKANLRACMKKHLMVFRCRDILEEIYGVLAIWMALTSAWSLCALVFQVSQMKELTIFSGISLALFMSLKLVQTYSYAWCGNAITQESEICIRAIYSSSWAGTRNLQIAKDALMILAQRPLVLKAKGCMLIHLDMFSKIINTTVSYFFLLQTLEEN